MFKEVADIKTSDQLHLPVPEAKFETVVAKPSEIQKEMVQELSKRAAKIHSGTVDASEDNMLCVTNDGRKIGLDVRLMNPMLPDDPNSKLNVCVRNVLKIWEEGKCGNCAVRGGVLRHLAGHSDAEKMILFSDSPAPSWHMFI